VSFDWLQKWQPSAGVTSFDEEEHSSNDDALAPDEVAVHSADVQRLRGAIEELPPDYREVVVLRELEGLNYQEIAAVAGVPVGTVMSRLSRARGRLRRRLAACSGGED
jgi:RNA polymerase sigma-70 factor (ECF subfamily)